MKKSKLLQIATLIAVAGTLTVSTASAALSLTMAENGVGWSDPSATPPEQADMLTYLNTMVGLFNNHDNGYTTTVTIPNATDGTAGLPTRQDQFYATVDKGNLVPSTLSVVSILSANNAVSGSPSSYTIHLGTGGYSYLIAGWGADSQGSDQVYYVGGLKGDVSISNDGQNGLSNFWLSRQSTPAITAAVPEPSTVIAAALLLLPLGASAFRILRKSAQV